MPLLCVIFLRSLVALSPGSFFLCAWHNERMIHVVHFLWTLPYGPSTLQGVHSEGMFRLFLQILRLYGERSISLTTRGCAPSCDLCFFEGDSGYAV